MCRLDVEVIRGSVEVNDAKIDGYHFVLNTLKWIIVSLFRAASRVRRAHIALWSEKRKPALRSLASRTRPNYHLSSSHVIAASDR